MSRYTITYERDSAGWWVAQAKELPAAITQGRSIAEARRRVREALALVLDDETAAANAMLVDRIKLPAPARRALKQAQTARRRVAAETARAQRSTAEAVRHLVEEVGLSVRDAGELLGLSHQRVQQLIDAGRPHPIIRRPAAR